MIRIVIAEDQDCLLGIIGSLLNLEEDMEVVGQSSNEEEVLTLVKEFSPDICLMDIEMYSKEGLPEELNASGCKLMVLTTFHEPGYFEKMVEIDIKGYLPKDSSSEEFVSSIRLVMNGGRIYSPALVEIDHEDLEETSAPDYGSFDSPIQQKKTIETVRSYLTAFKDKMKITAG
jgi:two-component system, NarL family, response regulator DesR